MRALLLACMVVGICFISFADDPSPARDTDIDLSNALPDSTTCIACDSVPCDTCYYYFKSPHRFIRQFPFIYNDTAYTSEQYHFIIRALWMRLRKKYRHKSTTVTVNEPESAIDTTRSMIRFVHPVN